MDYVKYDDSQLVQNCFLKHFILELHVTIVGSNDLDEENVVPVLVSAAFLKAN